MSVVEVLKRKKPGNEEEMQLKYRALQIAADLPEDPARAIAVLDYAREIVVKFIAATN